MDSVKYLLIKKKFSKLSCTAQTFIKINYKIWKKNLILGTAIDYDWKKVKIFVKSIRAHSNCEIYFLVNKLNRYTKKKFDIYKIKLIHCNLRPYEYRYRYIYFFNSRIIKF